MENEKECRTCRYNSYSPVVKPCIICGGDALGNTEWAAKDPPTTHCKWYQDDYCVNADCPYCAEWCEVGEHPEVCRYYEGVE